MPYQLSPEDLAVLELERLWFRQQGNKETEIFQRFGLTPARYTQRVAALVYRPEAMLAAPDVCRRVQSRLEQRGRRRLGREVLMRAASRTTAP